jgi:error-prone DNA polymerase
VWGGYYSPRVYMSEARRLGLAVHPPHINYSNEAFTLEIPDPQPPQEGDSAIRNPQSVWMGLGQVRDLTHASIQTIIAQRPFASLQDFLARAQPLYMEAVNLVKAGALEGLGNPKVMLDWLERSQWHGRHAGQMSLALGVAAAWPEPDVHERAAWEREVLGLLVSVHPLQLVSAELARHTLTRSDELDAHNTQEVTLAGVRLSAHRFSAKEQGAMLLVDMEDEAGTYQVLWSGAALKRYTEILSQREPVLVRGRARADRQGQIVVVGHEIMLVPGQRLDAHSG